MPENPSQINQEITQLEKALAEKRAVLERQKESGTLEEIPHDKEILREVVREKISTVPPSSHPQPIFPSSNQQGDAVQSSYDSDDLKPAVDELVEQSFEKSLESSIARVKATNNAALIDAFHDKIVDELYDRLVMSKKLESV